MFSRRGISENKFLGPFYESYRFEPQVEKLMEGGADAADVAELMERGCGWSSIQIYRS